MTGDPKSQAAKQKAEIEASLRRIDSLPILDSRSEDEILGYDEHGMPESSTE